MHSKWVEKKTELSACDRLNFFLVILSTGLQKASFLGNTWPIFLFLAILKIIRSAWNLVHNLINHADFKSEILCVCVCVCVCVCPSKNFGAAHRAQKWLDLTKIWYTCSLGEYVGIFFSFFENFQSPKIVGLMVGWMSFLSLRFALVFLTNHGILVYVESNDSVYNISPSQLVRWPKEKEL